MHGNQIIYTFRISSSVAGKMHEDFRPVSKQKQEVYSTVYTHKLFSFTFILLTITLVFITSAHLNIHMRVMVIVISQQGKICCKNKV